jgi:ketosteroid isomerase-like protein
MSRENVEVARRLIDAVNRDDLPRALACLDPDVEWIAQLAAVEGAYHGHEGFETFMADIREAWERFQLHVELHDLGDRVRVAGTISARGRGSGVEMGVAVCGIFDFRDTRIVRWQAFGSEGDLS